MKKILIGAFIFMVMLLMSSVSAFAVNAEPEQSDTSIQASIENAIVLFYENKDIEANNDFSMMMDEDISKYLTDKIYVEKHVTNIYKTGKEHYAVQVRLIDKKAMSEQVQFTFQVITTYNYENTKDLNTEISEEVIVTYDCDKGLITDFYSPFNYYDVAIRGENGKSLADIPEEDRKTNLDRLMKDIGTEYTNDTKESDQLNERTEEMSTVRSGALNSANIVSYARNNYYKSQPSSGNGVVPYYDFSEIPGNWDCTNFVSHALIAGGAGVYDTGGSGISSTGWYFRNISNRSSSWSGVTNLYQYLVNNTHSNSASGIANMYTHNGAFWGRGDVMQFKFSGSSNYGHSTIITKKTYSSDGTRAYAYVTGRTSDTQYNNNQAVDNMAPGGSKRTIYVYNY